MIHIRGPLARVILAVVAVFGLLVALGDVLDFYDAYWKVSVPLTLIYAAGIWFFALRAPKGEPPLASTWPLGLDVILAKLFMTVAALFVTLGAVALLWDFYKLILQHWHYIVVALGVVVVIIIVALFMGGGSTKRKAGKATGARAPRRQRRGSRPGDVAP